MSTHYERAYVLGAKMAVPMRDHYGHSETEQLLQEDDLPFILSGLARLMYGSDTHSRIEFKAGFYDALDGVYQEGSS